MGWLLCVAVVPSGLVLVGYDAAVDLVVGFGWVCLVFVIYDGCVNSVDFSFLFLFVIICDMFAVCSWLELPVYGYLVVVYGAYFRICLLFGVVVLALFVCCCFVLWFVGGAGWWLFTVGSWFWVLLVWVLEFALLGY